MKTLPTQLRNATRKQFTMAIFIFVFAAAGTLLLILSQAATAVSSVKTGRWSDPTVWSNGRVPEVGDTVTITAGHTVTFDLTTSPKIAETFVRGTLTFDPAKSSKLVTNRNMVVTGDLVMKPANANVEHFLQFADINEQNFVGGGMDVLASDVGLWVMGSGQLDIAGAPKKSWTHLAGGVTAGATSITLKDAPTGWRVGDTITIAPTQDPTVGAASYEGFEERDITAISGNTVSFGAGLTRPHPQVDGRWTAEVGNLSRNVRIEGTATRFNVPSDWQDRDRHNGNSHIFIRANGAQKISNAQLRYMGTAGANEGGTERITQPTLGRYSIHFHHAGNGSRGSVVDSVVVRDANFHQFVPHASHGIKMTNNISYNSKSGAFWWDPHDNDPNSDSHDVVWDHNLVAKMEAARDESPGFFLLAGHNVRANNNTVVGIRGSNESQGAYFWVNSNEGMWVFDGNTAHNNQSNGIHVWQNAKQSHPITNFALYYNQFYGIAHGAYVNDYNYINGYVYGNRWGGLKHQANASSPIQQTYQNVVWDGAGITPVLVWGTHSSLNGSLPVLFSNNTFKNYTRHAVLIGAENITSNGAKEYGGGGLNSEEWKQFDIVNPTFEGSSHVAFGSGSSSSNNRVRVQPRNGGQPYQVTSGNTRTNISRFGPTTFGTGTGLLAEHFLYKNGAPQFTDPIFTRRENTLTDHYAQDTDIPPHWVAPWPQNWTVRLTGEFEAQATTNYTFIRDKYMGLRLWIDDQQVINAFNESDREVRSTPVAMVQGRRYKIRAELNFFDGSPSPDTRFLYYLFTESDAYKKPDGTPQRLVPPMGQLYCGTHPACNINHYALPKPFATPGTDPDPDPEPTPPQQDTTPPTVSVTAPANNATVSGTINVTANASDNDRVTDVQFLVDGQVRGTDTSSPYSFSLNTTNPVLSNGNHTITARAVDPAGNSRTATNITVNVNNATTPPPPTFRPEDINQDQRVNLLDFSLLAFRFNQTAALGRADINGDGRVNGVDFDLLTARYGQ